MIEKRKKSCKVNKCNRLIFVSTRTNYSFPVEEGRVSIYGFVTAKTN